jgi:long-chain acyl-CoA synthetase
MARRTLIDFFEDVASIPAEFLTYDDGYRTWSYSYGQVAEAARAFAARLDAAGIGRGDTVAIWAENRPEWIIAFWGCLLNASILVPIDYRASASFLSRVADIVDARVLLVGEAVDHDAIESARPIWSLVDLRSDRIENRGRVTPAPDVTADDTAEIIFTSGATADPKGVVITHRNILANIVPIEREIAKYRRYMRPFLPIRFLNLLPLSHMFGQAMATFVPPMLPGLVLFTRSYAPEDIVRQIRRRRISVLVCVPKILEVLKDYVMRVHPETADDPGPMHWVRRWWYFRRVHRAFGLKFWAFVVGAAPLDPALETFWGRLGFVVVQGYGLTETAPIVTLNHPLRAAKGAVGKPIAGVELKIAEDGEILVRGENVTRGYYNAPEETQSAFRDGWFHTGDVGEIDDKGQLHIRGRKKEMIVTPEGLNVFPEDVERAINAQPGVKDSAVVGSASPGSTAERVHAIVVLDSSADIDAVVKGANAQLGDHQKIRTAVAWPEPELPRTEGTRKLKRRELRQWLVGQQTAGKSGGAAGGRSIASVLERFSPGRTITPATTIDELGLSSLERVELMMALEEAFQVTVDEAQYASAKTVGDLEALTKPLDAGVARPASIAEPIDFPAWNRSWPARTLRRGSLPTWILPLARVFMQLKVAGLENLNSVQSPVIFASSHQSHFDTPAIFAVLPARWRYRVAPAMAKEFFKAHFFPEQFGRAAWATNSANYYLAALFFNAFPLPQRETGTRQTLRYIGELVTAGYSVLIFPEGRRNPDGSIGTFQPGTAMIAAKLGVPVIPVRLEGLDRILHPTWKFPVRGPAHVSFGKPVFLEGSDYAALSRKLEEAVKALG